MSGYSVDIEARTLENQDYRHVLFTGPHSQLVVMTLQPGEEIGLERHEHGDQFIRIEAGHAVAIIDGVRHELPAGSAVVIPSGSEHNVINLSDAETLRLYTLYAPAQHAPGTVQRTKAEADAAELAFAH